MKVTFDNAKDRLNREKHGLPLRFGEEVIRLAVRTVMDARFDYGEDRLVSFGYVRDRLYVCVYTVRGDETRIISVRKANDREAGRYGRADR
jgi:uncharacterized DUF497 family protein